MAAAHAVACMLARTFASIALGGHHEPQSDRLSVDTRAPPRNATCSAGFRPTLAAAPANPTELDSAYDECRQLLVEGKLDSSGRVASGAAGVAAGGATMAAGAAAASSAGLYGGMALASATVVLIPVALIGGAFGMSRIKRGQK